MTLAQLLARTMTQIGEDQASLAQYRDIACAYLNEALSDITEDELVTTDVVHAPLGTIQPAQLSQCAVLVLQVLAGDGGEIPFTAHRDGTITCGRAPRYVRYRYVPRPLVEQEDVPSLPERFHGALCDYAAYRILGLGGRSRQMRGDVHRDSYLRARERLQKHLQREQGRLRIAHKYG